MKQWKGYSMLDLILLLAGVLSIVIATIVFNATWYLMLNSIFAILCVFTQAKGKIITQFLGLTWALFYIYIAYIFHYYGEVIITIVVVIPMYIYGIVHWLKNKKKDSDTVIIRQKFSSSEWIVILIGLAVAFVLIYFLLKYLNTAQLLTNTISFIVLLLAMYMLVRRHKWNLVPFLIQDLINPLFWIPVIIAGDMGYIVMLIHLVFQTAYDIYGIIQWNKESKAQKKHPLVDKN